MTEEDAQREDRVRADERHRLAQYLHDHLAQTLTLAKLQLTRMQQTLREPLDPAKQVWLQTTVDSMIPQLNDAMRAVQDEVFVLNPAGLSEVGLTAMVEEECEVFSRRTGIQCHRRCDALGLDAERGVLVVLIVREALSNIARHSRATTAEVTLQRRGGQGMLSVHDNGIGIDPRRLRAAESFGIRGMEERARTLGSELLIESTPTEGTRLSVSFPLAPREKNTSSPD
jgi:signal transduction histidine kinase